VIVIFLNILFVFVNCTIPKNKLLPQNQTVRSTCYARVRLEKCDAVLTQLVTDGQFWVDFEVLEDDCPAR